MAARLSFFPVGNGDMTLIQTEAGHTILIDMNIRSAADDPDDDTLDVASRLREKLTSDAEGRLYVDALLISHPDEDHCRGLRNHFHLGPPDRWSKSAKKILIREIWSSPTVFRRASKKHVLCEDAKAFNTEAKRRVQIFRDTPWKMGDGNRILILGDDEDGKTEDLETIQVHVGNTFSRINGTKDGSITVHLLAPLPATGEEEESVLTKNNSSTILVFSLDGDGSHDKCRFLTGGDAEVEIWERLWDCHQDHPEALSYDILLSPHHCSWHSLSHESWSEWGEDAKVSEDALDALSQALDGATIVSSSNPIEDDDNDPPCIRAKREYEKITKNVAGSFECIGEHPSKESPAIMEFEISRHGLRRVLALMGSPTILGPGTIGRQPLSHG